MKALIIAGLAAFMVYVVVGLAGINLLQIELVGTIVHALQAL